MHSNIFGICRFAALAVAICPAALASPISDWTSILAQRQSPTTPKGIYPQKGKDPAYSVPEDKLKSAINLPKGFTYGSKLPVILSPGTGATGDVSFSGNFQKQFANSSIIDGVTLNIPNNTLDDIQVNAEYVAYAINYVSGISNNKKVGVLTWSQGSIDLQWALKYFSSTRASVSDFVAISPDFKGSTISSLSPTQIGVAIPPALIQQYNTALFIATLRNNGGTSAYVPTTTVYSSSDEIVQPQDNTPGASGFIDGNSNMASNNLVQARCPNQAAGENYTHEAMLYNPLSYALAIDAFTHDGPGDVARLDLDTICAQLASPGLGVLDQATTQAALTTALANEAAYTGSVTKEPRIKDYAAKDIPAGRSNSRRSVV